MSIFHTLQLYIKAAFVYIIKYKKNVNYMHICLFTTLIHKLLTFVCMVGCKDRNDILPKITTCINVHNALNDMQHHSIIKNQDIKYHTNCTIKTCKIQQNDTYSTTENKKKAVNKKDMISKHIGLLKRISNTITLYACFIVPFCVLTAILLCEYNAYVKDYNKH